MTCEEARAAIRSRQPLLHCISNVVTSNDCANLALAVGASPIMAQAPQEMAEIAALADAVVLNTGTPNEAKFTAARLAGSTANRRGVPVVLDRWAWAPAHGGWRRYVFFYSRYIPRLSGSITVRRPLCLQAAEKFPPTQPRKPQTLYHLILPRWSTVWTA